MRYWGKGVVCVWGSGLSSSARVVVKELDVISVGPLSHVRAVQFLTSTIADVKSDQPNGEF
jgi:hypothetical protein